MEFLILIVCVVFIILVIEFVSYLIIKRLAKWLRNTIIFCLLLFFISIIVAPEETGMVARDILEAFGFDFKSSLIEKSIDWLSKLITATNKLGVQV